MTTAGIGHNGGPDLFEVAPQPGPQASLLSCPIEDVLFGGAVGGGKTYGMLLDFLQHALAYGANVNGLFVRRIGSNLDAVIAASQRIFPRFGGVYRQRSGWTFFSGPAKGARLRFRHMWDQPAAVLQFQGDDFTWVCIEEMGQYPTPDAIDYLKTRLRSSAGVPTLFRATANPGGAGHGWIKARYVSPHPVGYKILVDPRSGSRRVFIPSKLEDNKILTGNDPGYEARMRGLGSPTMVKALRFGDWNIVAGAFFDDIWSPLKHISPAFEIPITWTRRMSFDWGSSKPASLGMWAISDGTQPRNPDRYYPRGTVVRFGEWYTVAKGEDGLSIPDVGLKLSNDELGRGIAERAKNINWSGNVADPSIFTRMGGPSLFDQMDEGAKKIGLSLNFSTADNSRVPGWQKMRQMLEATSIDNRELPGFMVTENCVEFIRTVPVLQRSASNPDDVDTTAEDHCFTADTAIMTERGPVPIGQLVGGSGATPGSDGGWHRFGAVRLTRRNTPIVKLTFSDGTFARCTPDHRLLKSDGSYALAVDMTDETCYTVMPCTSPLSAPQSKSSKASGTTCAASTFRTTASACIGWFTSGSRVRSRKVSTSTTATMTGQTTSLRTSLLCLRTSICLITARLQALASRISKRPAPLPLSGTEASKARFGIASTTTSTFGLFLLSVWRRFAISAAGLSRLPGCRPNRPAFVRTTARPSTAEPPASTMRHAFASSVPSISKLIATRRSGFAPGPAAIETASPPLRVIRVEPAGRADVFCMTVPTSSSFALANGAVVHNCGDESRYLVMSTSSSGAPTGGVRKAKTRGR